MTTESSEQQQWRQHYKDEVAKGRTVRLYMQDHYSVCGRVLFGTNICDCTSIDKNVKIDALESEVSALRAKAAALAQALDDEHGHYDRRTDTWGSRADDCETCVLLRDAISQAQEGK